MKVRLTKRRLLKLALVPVVVLVLYWGLLCFPQPFFRWSVSASNLTLYSDRSFSSEEGSKILELVESRLESSPLFSAQMHHSVFVCNAHWRQLLFFNRRYGVGGVNYYPLTSNVFLAGALIGENRLISPSGNVVQGDRTLDYFTTHEITHSLTKRAAGWYHHIGLPEYVQEGYPDYVAQSSSFNYDDARKAFLAEAPEMDRWMSGLYLRYHLLVAHLLEKEDWSVQRLLTDPPAQNAVEEAIRKEAP